MDDAGQGGGVGAFAEEEANKKRQKKEDSVSLNVLFPRQLKLYSYLLFLKP
jgi:hypothetical protein